jgi:hypothetical protein
LEQRDIIFTAKVISASLSQKEVHIFILPLSNCEDPKPSYRLLGCTFRRACTIIKGNSIVAQVLVTVLVKFNNDIFWVLCSNFILYVQLLLDLFLKNASFYQVITTIVNYFFVQTNLLYKLKKVFYSRRKFRVTIYPDNDHFFVMAMIMTFFIAEK